MKAGIIYYSYTGNTRKVAQILSEYLRKNCEIDTIELKAQDESKTFFGQAARAFRHKRARIIPVNFDLSGYDLVCFGTPVWAFGPACAMNAYLDRCFGLEGKKAVLFVTYGSGAGKDRCLNYMQDTLTKKGAGQFSKFFIQQLKTQDREFILSKIKEVMRL